MEMVGWLYSPAIVRMYTIFPENIDTLDGIVDIPDLKDDSVLSAGPTINQSGQVRGRQGGEMPQSDPERKSRSPKCFMQKSGDGRQKPAGQQGVGRVVHRVKPCKLQ